MWEFLGRILASGADRPLVWRACAETRACAHTGVDSRKIRRPHHVKRHTGSCGQRRNIRRNQAVSEKRTAPRATTASEATAALPQQYRSGPLELTGGADALYERHLLFDNVADPAAAGPRQRFEAFARSVRDILSQRWVRTEQTYERENPKRGYYLSMEFLIGRSLANNTTNLLLDPVVSEAVKHGSLDWLALLEEEPDAGLGNGGLARPRAWPLHSMAPPQLSAVGEGARV